VKKLIVASALLAALSMPALAQNGNDNSGGNENNSNGGTYGGVPGPLAGAGLPFIAVGYGVYWLVRRRRNAK
jgi:hypothetical protein